MGLGLLQWNLFRPQELAHFQQHQLVVIRLVRLPAAREGQVVVVPHHDVRRIQHVPFSTVRKGKLITPLHRAGHAEFLDQFAAMAVGGLECVGRAPSLPKTGPWSRPRPGRWSAAAGACSAFSFGRMHPKLDEISEGDKAEVQWETKDLIGIQFRGPSLTFACYGNALVVAYDRPMASFTATKLFVEAFGHQFKTRSDSEIFIAIYGLRPE